MKKNALYFLLFTLIFYSCQQKSTGIIETPQQETEKEDSPFIAGNQKIVQLENEEIELFLKRYNWKMTETGTGLRYQILEEGSGDYPKKNEQIEIEYKMYLLTGEEIYNSEDEGVITFKVHKTEGLMALHEVALLMRRGGKARLVFPSHLGHGLAGDGKKIIGAKPLVMEISIKL